MKIEIFNDIEIDNIDWDNPQYVISECGCIILTTGENISGSFSGMVLAEESSEWGIGYYSTKWSKRLFKPFYGKNPLEKRLAMKPDNISLRDWFAGMAMQALLSQPNIGFILKKTNPAMSPEDADQAICATSFRIGDKMMKERLEG